MASTGLHNLLSGVMKKIPILASDDGESLMIAFGREQIKLLVFVASGEIIWVEGGLIYTFQSSTSLSPYFSKYQGHNLLLLTGLFYIAQFSRTLIKDNSRPKL